MPVPQDEVKTILSNVCCRNKRGKIPPLGSAQFPCGGSEECKSRTSCNSCTVGLLPEEEQLYSASGRECQRCAVAEGALPDAADAVASVRS